ncbi:alpha/beta fold hydrolase [Candidatus Phycosocius spiralis]|uniref:Lysophospholipase n=1 Tax=Candidatus Phycosocius spiralis TaxID=2815099 RepID=A0ABQ4PUG1_9PROT|nr:alpha/beta hydrolase [Candidatus Phycosocius spiralis]GIU66662.1 lysophospholipase [Candidatus Phycosocius spiralis]
MQLVRDAFIDALTKLEVFRVKGPDDLTIRAAFLPYLGKQPRGSIILAPGRSEYIEKYAETLAALQTRGFNVLVVDHRGQGWSDRLGANQYAGHMDSFAKAGIHLNCAIEAVSDRLTGKKIVLSHSMGGCISLEALLSGTISNIVGAAFCAPMWGLIGPPVMGVIAQTLVALGLGKHVAPTLPKVWHPEPFEANPLTHDQKRFARNNALFLAEPCLQLAGPTNGWINQALKTLASFTPERLATLAIPILVVSAQAEALVDNHAHVRVVSQLPHAQLHIVPGAKHELMQEIDALQQQFWGHFDTWVETVLT